MAVDDTPRAGPHDTPKTTGAHGANRDRGPINSVMKNAITACDLAYRSAERAKERLKP